MSSREFGISNPMIAYALGRSSREFDPLNFPGTVFAPYTCQLLTEARLTAGMRVPDVGSESGDLSVLAVDPVGSHGYVLGGVPVCKLPNDRQLSTMEERHA